MQHHIRQVIGPRPKAEPGVVPRVSQPLQRPVEIGSGRIRKKEMAKTLRDEPPAADEGIHQNQRGIVPDKAVQDGRGVDREDGEPRGGVGKRSSVSNAASWKARAGRQPPSCREQPWRATFLPCAACLCLSAWLRRRPGAAEIGSGRAATRGGDRAGLEYGPGQAPAFRTRAGRPLACRLRGVARALRQERTGLGPGREGQRGSRHAQA